MVDSVAEHHALRRQGILDAAVDVLGEDGIQAVTPAAVAARTGLARNSIYQYHPSTGALVAAAVEEAFRRALAEVAVRVSPDTDASQRLRGWITAGLNAAVSGHAVWRAEGADLPQECHQRVVELHTRLQTPLVDALTELAWPEPKAMAELVAGLVRAGADQVRRGDEVDAVVDRIVTLLPGQVGSVTA